MAWSVTVAAVIGGGTAVISGSVALLAWHHRSRWMALPFGALAITLAIWPLLYGIQLGYGTLAEQLVWQQLTLGVAGFVPTMWVLFVLAHTDRTAWLTQNRVILFLSEPIAFFLLCLTNPSHGLIWTDAALTSTVVGDVPALEFGIGYAIHITYAYLAVAAGIGLLVLYGTQVAPMYQKQVLLLVTGTIPPFLSHIAFTFEMGPIPHLDLTPFLFAFTGIVFGLALFRFELLKLAPVARVQSLKEVGDGLIIVNTNGKVVDVHGVASGVLDPTPTVGEPISDVFPDTSLEELDNAERTAILDNQRRVHQFRVSSLTDHTGRQVGTILILRDITGLRDFEQRLSVSNRVLRHNLRNDMNVILGFATQLESRLDGQDARDARQILKTSKDLLALTEKAKQITQLHAAVDGDESTIDAVEHLRTVIDELQAAYPEAEFRLNTAAEVFVDVTDSRTFRLALENVLDNALRHNDAPVPRAEISVEQTADTTRIEVRDNGPGIPEIEQNALQSGIETSLKHSQGLGLWLTYWCVTMWKGALELDSRSDGSTVVMTVPTAEPHSTSDGMPENAAI